MAGVGGWRGAGWVVVGNKEAELFGDIYQSLLLPTLLWVVSLPLRSPGCEQGKFFGLTLVSPSPVLFLEL